MADSFTILENLIRIIERRMSPGRAAKVLAVVRRNRGALLRAIDASVAAMEDERTRIESLARARAADMRREEKKEEPKPLVMVGLPWDRNPNKLLISSPYRMDSSTWDRYQRAVTPLRFVKRWGAEPSAGYEGTTKAVANVVASLQRSGFEVRASDNAAAAALAQGVEQAGSLVRQADAHIQQVVRRLPSTHRPRPYQIEGIRWLAATPVGLVLDEMGLGKTMQVLLAAGDRLLVISPASVKAVWEKEARLWRPDLKPTILSGRDSFRWPRKGEIVIVNYSMLRPSTYAVVVEGRKHNAKPVSIVVSSLVGQGILGKKKGKSRNAAAAALTAAIGGRYPQEITSNLKALKEAEKYRATLSLNGYDARIDVDEGVQSAGPAPAGTDAVADEVHYLKNSRTKRHQAVRAIMDEVEASNGHRWGATATPLTNRPVDLRDVLRSIGAFDKAFGSKAAFSRAFGGKEHEVEAKPTPDAAEQLAQISIRRLKKDVAKELPPKTKTSIPVTLDDKAARAVAAIERKLMPAVEEAVAVSGARSAEEIAEAVRVALHKPATIGAMAKARKVIALAKLPASLRLIERLEKQGRPVLFLSAHSSVTDAFKKRRGWAVIDGALATAKRQPIVDAFQDGKLRGIALTIKAGGTGLTLTRAADVVVNDREWSDAANEQAYDRAHRIGSTNPVTIYILKANAWLEDRLAELIDLKAGLHKVTVNPVQTLGGRLPTAVDVKPVEVGLADRRPHDQPARWTKIDDKFYVSAPVDVLTAALKSKRPIKVTSRRGIKDVYIEDIKMHGGLAYGVPPARGTADADVVARVITMAEHPDAGRADGEPSLIQWLHNIYKKEGRVPDTVKGKPIREVLVRIEKNLAKKRRKREMRRENYHKYAVPAKTEQEHFAAEALETLGALDPDHAQKQNDVGFSASTQDGHELLSRLREFGGLRPDDWKRAKAIAKVHHIQVGEFPS